MEVIGKIMSCPICLSYAQNEEARTLYTYKQLVPSCDAQVGACKHTSCVGWVGLAPLVSKSGRMEARQCCIASTISCAMTDGLSDSHCWHGRMNFLAEAHGTLHKGQSIIANHTTPADTISQTQQLCCRTQVHDSYWQLTSQACRRVTWCRSLFLSLPLFLGDQPE